MSMSQRLIGLATIAALVVGCNSAEQEIPHVQGIETPTTTAAFQQDVLESNVPVLVDFSATWCGPCKMMAPIIAQASLDYDGKVHVKTVDIDENPELSNRYRVDGVPTMILFANGEEVDRIEGACPDSYLRDFLDQHVLPATVAPSTEFATAPAGETEPATTAADAATPTADASPNAPLFVPDATAESAP